MKQIIEEFITEKKVAIAGVSRKPDKWGNALMKELTKLGYEVFPVNPNADELQGVKCYRSVKELPEDVVSLIFATKPADTELITAELTESRIKRVWMQKGAGKGSYSEKAFDMLKETNIGVVYGLCPMMFFNGTGIHKFHYNIKRILGRLPVGVN